MSTRLSPTETLASLSSNPRATLSCWLRLQDVIHQAYKSFPSPFLYTPQNLSCSSFIIMARDAIRGAIAFSYPSFCTPSELQEWNSQVIFSKHLSQVYIGLKNKPDLSAITGTTSEISSSPYQFTTLTLQEIYSFCILLSSGRLQGPVEIVSPPPSIDFSPFVNLEKIYKPNGTLVLL